MKKLLLAIGAIILIINANAQFNCSCLPDGITFTTQAQIDSFPINYPGCTEISGSINIAENDYNNISNLDGFSVLTSIGGNLCIFQNTSLYSLHGLHNLNSIGGTLMIGNKGPYWAPCLGNDIADLNDLSNLTSIGGSLHILYNGSLTDLSGLEGVEEISGDLVIDGNFSLAGLTGLSNLFEVGGNLIIGTPESSATPHSGNLGLQNLDGLLSLNIINGYIEIATNDSLENLSGIANISPETITELYIHNNPILSTCHCQSICDYLAAPNGTIEIHDNASGCNSPEEVEEACMSVYIEDESLSKDQVSVFPNPVFDHVNISGITKSPGNLILRIFNSNGSLLDQKQYACDKSGSIEVRLNMNAYKAGMYFIQLQAENQLITKKIIKK